MLFSRRVLLENVSRSSGVINIIPHRRRGSSLLSVPPRSWSVSLSVSVSLPRLSLCCWWFVLLLAVGPPSLCGAASVSTLESEASLASPGGSTGSPIDALMRVDALQRLQQLKGAGEKNKLLKDLSRMGFDVGQALRDNLNNAKQPSSTGVLNNRRTVKVPCRRKADETLRTILGPAFNARYMSVAKPGALKPEVLDDMPPELDAFIGDQPSVGTGRALPFSVEPGYRRVLEGEVTIQHTSDKKSPPSNVYFARDRRESEDDPSSSGKKPGDLLLEKAKKLNITKNHRKGASDLWTCQYELVWTDLGEDHYPRFLKEAKCKQNHCWFGKFECRPKAFAVKVLRRWSDSCEITNEQYLSFVAAGKSSQTYDFSKDDHEGNHPPATNLDFRVPPELEEKWVWEEIGVNFVCECGNSKDNPGSDSDSGG